MKNCKKKLYYLMIVINQIVGNSLLSPKGDRQRQIKREKIKREGAIVCPEGANYFWILQIPCDEKIKRVREWDGWIDIRESEGYKGTTSESK